MLFVFGSGRVFYLLGFFAKNIGCTCVPPKVRHCIGDCWSEWFYSGWVLFTSNARKISRSRLRTSWCSTRGCILVTQLGVGQDLEVVIPTSSPLSVAYEWSSVLRGVFCWEIGRRCTCHWDHWTIARMEVGWQCNGTQIVWSSWVKYQGSLSLFGAE